MLIEVGNSIFKETPFNKNPDDNRSHSIYKSNTLSNISSSVPNEAQFW